MSIKVAMIGQKGAPSKFGGIETHVEQLSTRLVQAGHDVTVYARPWYTKEGSGLFNGMNVKVLPSLHTKHLDAISHTFLSLVHACLVLRPDVIHIHGVGPSLLAWIPRVLRPNAAIVTTFHCIDRQHGKWNSLARFALQLGEKACVRLAHETIAVSKTLANYIAVNFRERVHYIPNGVTPQRTVVDDILLKPHGLRSYGYIAMVSRLVSHKGAHVLVDAWKKVRREHPELVKDTKLAFVGDGAFTDTYVKQLKQRASDDDSIVFTGYQRGDVLKSLFAGAKFMVHPSFSEGLPIAVLEGMSYGKAVVASDIPENMEVVEDYGVPFVTGSVDDLAEKIVELLQDDMHAASIGHAAREFVETQYHWDDIARETAAIYKDRLELAEGVLAIQ